MSAWRRAMELSLPRLQDRLRVTKDLVFPDGSVISLHRDVLTLMRSGPPEPAMSLSLITPTGWPSMVATTRTKDLFLASEAGSFLMRLTQLLTNSETISLSKLDIGKLKECL